MQYANIQWNGGQPFSLDFDDVYYSLDNGLQETEFVFIQHNQLIDRFKSLKENTFTIHETGFGTGLNFFVAAKHWLENAPANTHCHYVSIECFPLKLEDMIRANQHWGEFDALLAQIKKDYSGLKQGINQLQIKSTDSRASITLELRIGDINALLPQTKSKADAWFLDGFAPAKNPTMWNEEVTNQIARLSKPNATFSTFTSAGKVKRQLQAVGFEVKKIKGFGKKREMLIGRFISLSI